MTSDLHPIRITLNGEAHLLPARMSILKLLERLEVDPRTVAVELDRVVVRRQRYGETEIGDGAEVEIVAFVGGG
jgi:thiamine biosynthesis protein ThiS